MKWWVWVLIAFFVLQAQKPANAATISGTTTSPGYSGGFGINLIF